MSGLNDETYSLIQIYIKLEEINKNLQILVDINEPLLHKFIKIIKKIRYLFRIRSTK